MRKILVATEEKQAEDTLREFFKGTNGVITATKEEWLIKSHKGTYDLLFIDIRYFKSNQEIEFEKLLDGLWQKHPDAEVIILTPHSMIRKTVQTVKSWGSHYLTYPIDPIEVKYIVDNIRHERRIHSELKYLRNKFWHRDSLEILQTLNPQMKSVFEKIRSVATTETAVLLLGETGTGKGIIANLIHRHSLRSEKQYIHVHCGAIPDTLLESELFGHEKGAFTGAIRKRSGKFEIAHGGTLFLDEIGTITPAMQVKLLQVLQEKTFQRVGGETTQKADVRIITATNADLKQMCVEGTFRQDLYYRLNIFPIEIPPLRERKEDIPLLVKIFLKRLDQYSHKNIRNVDPEVYDAFQAYDWPGNIRELENLIERAYIIESSSTLTINSFPSEFSKKQVSQHNGKIDLSYPLEEIRKQVIAKTEREYIAKLLEKNKGKINQTANDAGIGVRQLHKLMAKYELHKKDYKIPPSSNTKSDL